jgi:lambda family phage portal protein
MLENFRRKMAQVLLRGIPRTRSYAGAGGGRLTSSWRASTSSADGELHTALPMLRNRSRELIRNNSYAKRAKVIVVNNVVGAGIGMQAQVRPAFRERLDDRINGAIEEAWAEWARGEHCHTAGRLHFCDLERLLVGEIFEAGEVFVRKHYAPFGDSRVPLALEVIESERLADDFTLPPGVDPERYRMGIEHDAYWRPIAYWVRERHPGDVRPYQSTASERVLRIPASQMIHLALLDRSPQTRGVPWLHTAMRRLNDMDGYTEAEIVAARAGAMYVGFIKSDGSEPASIAPQQVDGQTQMELEPGLMQRLNPGEEVEFNNPNRPNAALDPFLRYLLREVASGIGISYESLSRDYSQSNYSSSRLALLDDRDLWRMLQAWFVRSFREPLHREWLQAAVYARAIGSISVEDFSARRNKYEAVKFKPRGWSWVDPVKEVDAFVTAVKAGFTTRTDVIAQTASGLDIEDIDATRRQELDAAADRDLVYETDPEVYAAPPPAPAPAPAPEPEPEDESNDEPPARLVSFGGLRQ